MSFSLAKREQILLLILVLVAIWVVSIMYIILPARTTYEANQDALTQITLKKQEMTDIINQRPTMDAKIEAAETAATTNSAKFFPLFNNENLGMWITTYTTEAGFRNVELKYSDSQPYFIAEYVGEPMTEYVKLNELAALIKGEKFVVNTKKPEKSKDGKKQGEGDLIRNTLEIEADCYYDNLLYFVDLMYNSGRTVTIDSIEIEHRKDSDKYLTAKIQMSFYSIPKFYEDNILDIEFEKPKGQEKLM